MAVIGAAISVFLGCAAELRHRDERDVLHSVARAWRRPLSTPYRATPLEMYCAGLLPPGERKGSEPMAAGLAPENVRWMHQSLQHMVAGAHWRVLSV
jgi:SRSO17 transposase